MKLSDLVRHIGEAGSLTVHASQCIHTTVACATCTRCVDICHLQAVQRTPEGISVTDACTQCGKCVSICPMGVFDMDIAPLIENEHQKAIAKKCLVLGCREAETNDACDLYVGCFQQFEPEVLLHLADRYGTLVLYAPQSACETCHNNWHAEATARRLEKYHLAEADRIHLITSNDALITHEQASDAQTRRAFLTGALQNVSITAGTALEGELRRLESHLPQWQTHATDEAPALVLRELIAPLYQARDALDEPLPYAGLTNTDCTFCAACVRLCPQQALQILEDEEGKYLAYHPLTCNDCGACIDSCMIHGLHRGNALKVTDLQTPRWQLLVYADAQTCKVCGQLFYTTKKAERCPFCQAIT